MRQVTYAVPGIHENAVQLGGLHMLVKLLLNEFAWIDAASLSEARANLDRLERKMMAALDCGDIASDVPSENERIRVTVARFLRDTFADARPVPIGEQP